MLSGIHILASTEGDVAELAAAVIVFIFWVIAQIVARINKPRGIQKMTPPRVSPQVTPARRQPARQAAIPNKYPPAIVQKAQAMQRAQMQRAQAMARRPIPAPPMVRPIAAPARRPLPPPLRAPAPAPAPRAVAPRPVVAPAPAMPDRTIAVQRRLPPASVAAASVLGLRADTLRQQIILAEILQPPVGLR